MSAPSKRVRELLSLIATADRAFRREYGATIVGSAARPEVDDFLFRAHRVLGRPGDYLAGFLLDWMASDALRSADPDLPERVARRRAQLKARRPMTRPSGELDR